MSDESGAIHPLDVDALVEELEPAEQEAADNEEKPTEAKSEQDAEATDEDKEAEDKDGAENSEGSEDGGDEEAKEDGYTIDQNEAESEEQKPETPDAEKGEPAAQLTPEQQYILDNIQPIKVRGVIGDSEQTQEFEVMAPEQLPDGFKFLDDKSREIASKQFGMLESRAGQVQQDFRSQESKKAADAFKTAEDAADRTEIGQMQRDGVIPKFTAKPDSAEFNDDPAVKLVQSVLDYKDQLNSQYLEAAQKGSRYKHIGFEEAYDKYARTHPTEKPKSEAQAKEDADRKTLARRTAKTAGTDAKSTNQEPSIFHNKRDMDAYLDNLEF